VRWLLRTVLCKHKPPIFEAQRRTPDLPKAVVSRSPSTRKPQKEFSVPVAPSLAQGERTKHTRVQTDEAGAAQTRKRTRWQNRMRQDILDKYKVHGTACGGIGLRSLVVTLPTYWWFKPNTQHLTTINYHTNLRLMIFYDFFFISSILWDAGSLLWKKKREDENEMKETRWVLREKKTNNKADRTKRTTTRFSNSLFSSSFHSAKQTKRRAGQKIRKCLWQM